MSYENYLFKTLENAAKQMTNAADPKDSVTMDVPLFIRMLELAREDIKSDEELHNVVERVLALKNQGTLTMDDYTEIVGEVLMPVDTSKSEPVLSDLQRLAGIR